MSTFSSFSDLGDSQNIDSDQKDKELEPEKNGNVSTNSQCIMSPSLLEDFSLFARNEEVFVNYMKKFLSAVDGMPESAIQSILSFLQNTELSNKRASRRCLTTIPALPGNRQDEVRDCVGKIIMETQEPISSTGQADRKDSGILDKRASGKLSRDKTSKRVLAKSASALASRHGVQSRKESKSASGSVTGSKKTSAEQSENEEISEFDKSQKDIRKKTGASLNEEGKDNNESSDSNAEDSDLSDRIMGDDDDNIMADMDDEEGRQSGRGTGRRSGRRSGRQSGRDSGRQSRRGSVGMVDKERSRFMTVDLTQPFADMPRPCIAQNPRAGAEDYYQKKGIADIFEKMLSCLVLEQPSKPLDYLIQLVRRMNNLQDKKRAIVEVQQQSRDSASTNGQRSKVNSIAFIGSAGTPPSMPQSFSTANGSLPPVG